MAQIERRNLQPVNHVTAVTEADRSRVIDIIRKRLADLMVGNQSYYPDGVQKDSITRASDLEDFIASIRDLRNRVDDPPNILGKAVDDLERYAGVFQELIKGNEPVDNIEVPRESSPTTKDQNEMYIPDLGPFSPPNPLLPDRWKKELEASLEPLDHEENAVGGGAKPDIFPRLRSRAISSALAGNNPLRQVAPSPLAGRPLGIFTGKPIAQWIIPAPLGGLDYSASGNGFGNWFSALAGASGDGEKPQASAIDGGLRVAPDASSDNPNFLGGLPGRIAALAGIDPQNPNQFALPPLDDELRAFYRDDPVQPWTLQWRR
jgi:hypothetical protein